ncbi:MAG: pantoate--beta-alanine ligase [Frankiaceae bacterium]
MTTTRTRPVVARTRGELARALARLRAVDADGSKGSVAFVPTMGALHGGHRGLIRTAHTLAEHVVVSIFVNPLQFAPGEDLAQYPRTFSADLAACREEGVALIFAPSPEVVYPRPPVVTVSAGPLGNLLEGASRPGHFDGVLTVVTKLFSLVQPDVAVFGEKDAQQLVLIRRMVSDLDLPVHVVGVPTVREPDGLALSSRNAYLKPAERAVAATLSRALHEGAEQAPAGPDAVRHTAAARLAAETLLQVDCLALVSPSNLQEVPEGAEGPALLAVVARIGTTRLIDNITLTLPPAPGIAQR